jgi:GNAT superfamily N-acetyltransferase
MEIEVKSLSPDLLGDFLKFFDGAAFSDNPGWASCYCLYNQFGGTDRQWARRRGAENRSAAIKLIQSGEMKGYLAYACGEVAGWCNANDRSIFKTIPAVADSDSAEEAKCCAIVCFIVAPERRRLGISRQLLKRVCADYAAAGYDCIEAYPRANAASCAQNYHGYLPLYLNEGFITYREQKNIRIVRKPLR